MSIFKNFRGLIRPFSNKSLAAFRFHADPSFFLLRWQAYEGGESSLKALQYHGLRGCSSYGGMS